MGTRRRGARVRAENRFGGDWTTEKLDTIQKYLSSYTQALKNTTFTKGYIDAFAGTGYRDLRSDDADSTTQPLLFPDIAAEAPQALLDGSARLALKTEPAFDRYVFIEQRGDRCDALERLKDEFPNRAEDILIRRGDANLEIRNLCDKDWRSHRAVLFLDPYGMQVEWATIESIAKTQAIDLWILFPLGIGVNRLLTRTGDIPEAWRQRLNLLLGTDDWYEEFYRFENDGLLFDDDERVVKASTEAIGAYFMKRLRGVFAGVADHSQVLRNSTGCPLYLLCFAVGNENGAKTALKIANYLLNARQK